MANILITGGSGLIGSALISELLKENHTLSVLSRSKTSITNVNVFQWDIDNEYIDEKAFDNLEYIIHLAGAGIADKRWTEKRKKEIIDSRVKSTELLLKKIKELNIPLKRFISASAIGYYGAVTSEKEFTETDNPSNDFLGTVCKLWEDSIFKFKKVQIPITIFRTGIVLSNNGGALSKMKTPVITPLGSGKQYMPWIHIDDMSKLYADAINEKLDGIYNAVAPEYHTNSSFSKLLAKKLKRPFLPIGVPSFVLRIVFGEMAVILLTGSKISSKKLIQAGFEFNYSKLEEALQELKDS